MFSRHPGTDADDPMVDNIIHTLLVTSNRMQAIPAVGIGLFLWVMAAITYGIWSLGGDEGEAATAAGVFLLTAAGDWLSLWLLPRFKRSFGPERPPTLALAVVRLALTLPLGLIGAPVGLAALPLAALSGVVLYSTWIAPFQLGVTYERLDTARLAADEKPLRVLHIGDLHLESITARERRLNALVHELAPDLIVFSGDFVNISYHDDPQTEAEIREIISAWQAPLGVYCVQGTYTVESKARVQAFTEGLDNLRLLDDEWVPIETSTGMLYVLGMTTTHQLAADQTTVQRLAHEVPADAFKLIVTHAPDVIPEADAAGYDLYVCGHTHGGQLRFPVVGAVFSGSALGMDYVMGRYDLDHLTAYTSRGVGMEGMGAPRARFLCPPEIILWEIHGTA